ncbi:MAG: flagellar protein FlgN [Magnetospirillum sp.]|nr:flagellar protein FlgN [Magnetospirillum sp.]
MSDSDGESGARLPYDDLVWVCTTLCELLQVENDALARHDPVTVAELAENKAALARLYEQAVEPMAVQPELVDTLSDEQKEELKALGAQLQQMIEANAAMLMAEQTAAQMMLDAMVNAAKKEATSSVVYNKKGTLDPSIRPEGKVLAVNRTL